LTGTERKYHMKKLKEMKNKINVHIEDTILWETVVVLARDNPNDSDLGGKVRDLVNRMGVFKQ